MTLAAFPGASAGTLPLPAGKYLVFAKAYIGFELGGSVLCDLHAAVPTVTLLADSSDVSLPSIGTVPLAMIGTLDVPLPTTLSLDCFANGAALAGAVQLSAIAVETIGP